MKYKMFFLFLFVGMLSACFHLESKKDFPPLLKTLSFKSDNVYNEISSDLKRKLHAMGAHLNIASAPLTLTLTNSKTITQIPSAFNSLIATVYRYEMRVHVELTYRKGGKTFPIIETTCSASQEVTHNANQVSSASFPPLIRRTLTRKLVNIIYHQLIALETQKRIEVLKQ